MSSPELPPLKARTVAAAIILPAVLILIGAGCFEAGSSLRNAGNELANQAAAPISTATSALNQATALSAELQAKANAQEEADSDEVSVAMILTENADVPAAAQVRPGAIGCNDRMAFVKMHRVAATNDIVHDALATLFFPKETNTEGLYNALAGSSLTVDSIKSPDGVTTEVRLKGKMVSAGACDTPRIKAQIEQTVGRFRPKYRIFLNGSESEYRCFGDESGECK